MKKTTKKGLALMKVLMVTVVCALLLLLSACELPSYHSNDNGIHVMETGTYSRVMDTDKSTESVIPHISMSDTDTLSNRMDVTDGAFSACQGLIEIGRKAFENCINAEYYFGKIDIERAFYCKKVLIKEGEHYERIKKLVKDSQYLEEKIEAY